LPGERDNARNNARCTQARKATHGLDGYHHHHHHIRLFEVVKLIRQVWLEDVFGVGFDLKTWTRLSVEESIRMTEDRDKWKKYVHGVANPRIEDG